MKWEEEKGMMRSEAAPEAEEWLVGEAGVWVGRPGSADWRRHGDYPFAVHGIHRGHDDLLVGTGHGLWQAPMDPAGRWVQLHDETLTEVLDVTRDEAGKPVAAGSYGVSVATADELGLLRWDSLTETLSPDQRYTNVLRLACNAAGQGQQWLAGTEAGVLLSIDGGSTWKATGPSGSPVRCIEYFDAFWWAGTDDHGLWRSHDTHAWERVESPSSAVFSIAASGDSLLLGGYDGIYRRDAQGVWQRTGPQALIRCLVVDGETWTAGADPGGLWCSQDAGRSWCRTGPFQRVAALCGPQRAEDA
jgi:hypothetical protein